LSSGLQATVRGTSPQSHQLIFSAPAAIVMQLSPHAEAGSSLAKGAFCQVKSRRHREMANAAILNRVAIVRWWLLSMCGSTVVVSLSSLKYAQVSYRLGMKKIVQPKFSKFLSEQLPFNARERSFATWRELSVSLFHALKNQHSGRALPVDCFR